MLIIPAIDIRDRKCVRLIQGDYSQERVYDADPVAVAHQFAEAGAQLIHVVDLDGAKAGEPVNWEVIRQLAKGPLPIEFGGGVRSLESARRLLDLDVMRVIAGTRLVQDTDFRNTFFDELGERAVAGIDCRDGLVATEAWTGQSTLSAVELSQMVEAAGAKRIILTDIARDGMLSGPNTNLLESVAKSVSIPIIQSGGIGTMEHLQQCACLSSPPEGVITGRAIYEGTLDLKKACFTFQ